MISSTRQSGNYRLLRYCNRYRSSNVLLLLLTLLSRKVMLLLRLVYHKHSISRSILVLRCLNLSYSHKFQCIRSNSSRMYPYSRLCSSKSLRSSNQYSILSNRNSKVCNSSMFHSNPFPLLCLFQLGHPLILLIFLPMPHLTFHRNLSLNILRITLAINFNNHSIPVFKLPWSSLVVIKVSLTMMALHLYSLGFVSLNVKFKLVSIVITRHFYLRNLSLKVMFKCGLIRMIPFSLHTAIPLILY